MSLGWATKLLLNVSFGANLALVNSSVGHLLVTKSSALGGIEMKKRWIIRKAVIEDATGLQKIMEAAYSAYQERMDGKRLPPMDVDYFSEIRDYPSWVAESNGSIVAGLIMVFEDEFASIANIAVHPEFQGQGVGRWPAGICRNCGERKGLL